MPPGNQRRFCRHYREISGAHRSAVFVLNGVNMEKQIKTFAVETKAIDPEAGVYEAMLSTEAVDRDDDVLMASGADFGNYLKNPVVLFGHNYSDPEAVVAKMLEITAIPGAGIKIVFQFLKRGISKTADLVHDLWESRYLNAMSIGFIPKETTPRPESRGLFFTLYEVLEGSIVTIPSNASALRLAFGETKSGRVLSAANEGKIRRAVETLTEVLAQLDKADEEGKSKEYSRGDPDTDGQPNTTNTNADTGDALELEDLTDDQFDELLQGIDTALDPLKEKYHD
jgi:hypothetical protein